MTMHRTITFNGETLTIPQWADKIGITAGSLHNRIREGWPLDKALTQPRGQTGPVAIDKQLDPAIRRYERARRADAARLNVAFSNLVRDIDRALNVFRYALIALDDQHRGVSENFAEMPNDRATPVAQDRA